MITPAILLISERFSFNTFPMEVAAAPIRTKMSVKPAIKIIVLISIALRAAESCCVISCRDFPEIKEIYPGMIGRTQGEINESKPKTNAVRMLIFSESMSFLYCVNSFLNVERSCLEFKIMKFL